MVPSYIRPYEISIWTLQDEFITVLKWSEVENKGQLQNGILERIDDGTEKLEVSVPLYYYDGNRKISNPLWQDLKNERIIPNMHKLKVIFNKKTADEAVYEFLVTAIDETHENNEITYDIHCEGLAFHELGKLGYKISLSADDYLNEWSDWFKAGQHGEAPVENLQYWNDKVFKYTNTQGDIVWKYNWTYEVQMDWSSFSRGRERDIHKVYEEEYVSSWNTTDNFLTFPKDIEGFREKWRPINVKESNIYNITQTIAETFGVFCKYKYEYDTNHHIVGRKVIYYNNFIEDSKGHIDLTYPYSSSAITRSIDNSETISKLYVRPVEDSTSDSNLISIMNVEANKSREDYLLDFDYMHDMQTISDEQYAEIEPYENKIRVYNNKLMQLEEKITLLRNQIVDTEAKVTFYTNAIVLDNERENNAKALRSQLTGDNDVIEITAANPEMLILKEDTTNNTKYVDISLEGVVVTSIALYKNINYTKTVASGERLTNPYTNFTIQLDDFGNVVKLTNIYINDSNINRLYMVCNYIPKLYYDNIVDTWQVRRYNDQIALEQAQAQLTEYKILLYGLDETNNISSDDALISHSAVVDEAKVDEAILDKGYGYARIYENLLKEKEQYIISFEKMMGAALREGYWQPDNYNDYGHKYYDQFELNYLNSQPIIGDSKIASLIWDSEVFDEETTLHYKVGVETKTEYYLIVDLSNCLDIIKNNLKISFIYYHEQIAAPREENNPITEYEMDLARRYFTVGSKCEYGFVYTNNKYVPVLVITGSSNFTKTQKEFIINNETADTFKPYLGLVKSVYDPETHMVKPDIVPLYRNLTFINPENISVNSAGYACLSRPRIRINSLLFKNSSEETLLSSNGNVLKNVDDYQVLLRTDQSDIDNSYYITIKPENIIKNGSNPTTIALTYALSNSNISIYLDALEVMKENARPKVSYVIKLNSLYKDFIKTAYDKLNRIVHINDYELAFNDVNGYISSLKLNLDQPAEDEVEIKNYKTKFEDLFTTIVAQTEAMKKNANIINLASQVINGSTGLLSSDILQDSMLKVDLNYAFNSGKLTIDEKNGIWGVSDAGVVAFRGGGIFTATTKDDNDNWQWNTGILPSGINASLITSGQLDTNRIKIYAGDKVKFQLNGQGLFAYKSLFSEENVTQGEHESNESFAARQAVYNSYMTQVAGSATAANSDVDASQYVTFNEKGLFLVAKQNALVLSNNKDRFIPLSKDVNRVEISWDGLILRNWAAQPVFWADPDTGNLNLEGTVYANAGSIGNWNIVEGTLSGEYMQLINNTAVDSGIFLTDKTNNSAKTIQWNGMTLYAYTINGNEDVAYYYEGYESTHRVTGNETIYKYGERISSVVPIATTQETKYVNGTTGSTATAADIANSETGGSYGQTSYTTGQWYTYTVTYVAVTQNGDAVTDNSGNKIIYDSDNSTGASWYNTLKNENKLQYVRITKVPSGQLEPDTNIAVGTILTLSVFKPKFKIYAATGEITIDNGYIGGFTLTANELRNGTLRNVNMIGSAITSSYITVGTTNYSTNDYARLFVDFTPSPSTGQFTLTRINGGTVTFNISDTTYFRSAVSDARVISLDLSISGSGTGASAVAVATTPGFGNIVSGYTARRTYAIGYLYRNGLSQGKKDGAAALYNSISILSAGFGTHGLGGDATGGTLEIVVSTANGNKQCQKFLDLSDYRNNVRNKVTASRVDISVGTSMSQAAASAIASTVTMDTGKTCSATLYGASNVWTSGYNAGVASIALQDAKYVSYTSNGTKWVYPDGGNTGMKKVRVIINVDSCFLGGTLVCMADGTKKPIEKLSLHDKLIGYDEKTHSYKITEVVTNQMLKRKKSMVDIYLSNNKIICATDTHPFLTIHGWGAVNHRQANKEYSEYNLDITQLKEGDQLISNNNETVIITKIIKRPDLNDAQVYNIDTEPYDTYLVENVVVHNKLAK